MLGKLLILISCGAVCLPQSAWANDEHWPCRTNPPADWERATGPDAGECIAQINGVPFAFDNEKLDRDISWLERSASGDALKIVGMVDPVTNLRAAELLFKQALAVAKSHAGSDPFDEVLCHVNLGTLYWQWRKLDLARTHFENALSLARQQRTHGLQLAAIQDQLALVHRGLYDYDLAEPLYRSSLEIREHAFGVDADETLRSRWRLAMLYSDKGDSRAQQLLDDIHKTLGKSVYVSAHQSPDSRRPVSLHKLISAPYGGELKDMVEFANEIILKHPPATPVPKLPPPPKGLAIVAGTWRVPTCDKVATRSRTRNYQTEEGDGVDSVTETIREDGVSRYENVDLLLCRASGLRAIWNAIYQYANENGHDPATFARDWPAIKAHAVELKKSMDAAANGACILRTRTDKSGEYQIKGIPAGSYILYASIATESRVLTWISPTISITKKCVKPFDFDETTITATLWQKSARMANARKD